MMTYPIDVSMNNSKEMTGETIEDLLLMIGDDENGFKTEAMDKVLRMGQESIFPTLEAAIRNDDNADLRNGAMEVLVKFGASVIPRLVKLLKDKNAEVRNFAAVMIGDIGSREAVGHLINALRDSDQNVRHGAAEALGKIADRSALVPLLELLKDDFWQQYPAIYALGEMKDNRAVPYLLQLISNPMLIEPIIVALGKIGDPRAVMPLLNILEDPSTIHSAAVARALVSIQKNLNESYRFKNRLVDHDESASLANLISPQGILNLKALLHQNTDQETIGAVVTLLGWRGDVTILPDFFSLLTQDDYLEVVEGAIISIGKPAVPALLDALSHQSVNVRIVALRALRWLGSLDNYELLLPMLVEEEGNVLLEVLESLKGNSDETFLPLLQGLLERGSEEAKVKVLGVLSHYPENMIMTIISELIAGAEPTKRRYGAMLVGLMDEGNVEIILPLLADSSDMVRQEAIKAAACRKLVTALPLLREALSDSDADIREAAIHALAEFGGNEPLSDILHMLGNDCERIDYAVIKALGQVGSSEVGLPLIKFLKKRSIPRLLEFAIIETLGKLSGEIEDERKAIIDYLKHPDPDIRRLAVTTLERIAGFDALSYVVDCCSDSHWSVRIAALQALEKIGGERVIPPLLKALEDNDHMVRKNAILIIGDLRNVKTIPNLVRQLTDLDMSKHAFEALLKFGRMGLPWLHRVLKGRYSLEARERVIDIIGKIGDRKSVEPLLEMLDDPSSSIRLAAIDSLVFCFDNMPLKKLARVKKSDADEEVKSKADLALKILTMEKFY